MEKKKQAYRQGDVIILCGARKPAALKELNHLVLAEGEMTGHRHQITRGEAKFFLDEKTQRRFLTVLGESALLTHEEHGKISLPRGTYEVRIQREYSPEGWRYVAD